MRLPTPTSTLGKTLTWMAPPCLALFFLGASVAAACGAEFPEQGHFLSERQFQEKLRSLERRRDDAEQARLLNRLLLEGRFSSLQVKSMAKMFAHEEARYDFALAAFPRTVDPENFYEVYDAFTSFSKVLRLHDQIQQLRTTTPSVAPGRPALEPVSDQAMADILKSIRAEGLEDSKKALTRQIFAGRRRFLSPQIFEVVKVFAFEDTRLEVAKLAYDVVLDPENYFLVNQAFSFAGTKDSLADFLESRRARQQRPPGR